MRKSFAQVLREGNVDIRQEYRKLYSILHQEAFDHRTKSLYEVFGENFAHFYFRGTCLSIEEFDQKYGFNFEADPDDFDIDYLVSFCEYLENMLFGLQAADFSGGYGGFASMKVNIPFILEQIRLVIEAIGYTYASDDGKTIFVEKSPVAIAVSESDLIPAELSYKVLEYDHYALKGDIEKKKHIILQLAQILEAKSKELQKISSSLKDDLFFLFNNLNLRHNNVDPSNKGKYKRIVSELDKGQLEHWYDETYQMCLLAFMELEQAERKKAFDEFKKQIVEG